MIVLACDLGGTWMKVGVVEGDRVLAQTAELANSHLGLAPGLPILRDGWFRLLKRLGLQLTECSGISMAFSSLVDTKTGRILAEYGKYADAMGLDLRAWAKEEFGLPLAIENDARMALLGEWKYGAGRGYDDLVMMTLGTGLGTAAVMEGCLLRGKHGQAGVLGGHLTVAYDGHACTCGNIGCAEAEGSAAFLHKNAAALPEWNSSTLRAVNQFDFRHIFKMADEGDACALKIRDRSFQVWSSLAVNLIHAYDPAVVIVGGGILADSELILTTITDYIRCHAHTPWGKVKVFAGQLGNTAALVAGQHLLREQFPDLP